jgi:hypothetical protein
MACSHTNSSSKQDRLATELVNVQQGRDREKELNHADNTSRQKSQSVAFESKSSEDEWSTGLLMSVTCQHEMRHYTY